MKAWLMNGYDGVEGLELRDDVPKPEPGPGQAVVKVHFAALNPADAYLAQKLYPARPTFPHILGRDASGVVDSLGPETSGRFQPGDAVALLRGDAGVNERGTLAEYVLVPEHVLVPIPKGWTEQQAAAAPLVYQTAHMALNQWGPLEKGSTILVTGITGGVGIASLQMAKVMGHRVVGISRSAAKAERLMQLGADAVIAPDDEELRAKVKEVAGKAGVALIVDNVGGKLLPAVIDTLGFYGKVSVVGMLAGPVPNFNTAKLFFKRLRIGGVSVSAYSTKEAHEAWNEIVSLLSHSEQRPMIDSVHEMADAKAAFAQLAAGPLGKVLVKVA